MKLEDFEQLLPESGLGVDRAGEFLIVVDPQIGPEYGVSARLTRGWLSIGYRFPLVERQLNDADLAVLLDMNDQLVVFRLALDEKDHPIMALHWPAEALDPELALFLFHEAIAHAFEGTARLHEYFAQ